MTIEQTARRRARGAGDAVVGDFIAVGVHIFPEPLDPAAAASLLAAIRATRRFDESLFLSEAEFDANPQYVGVNPRPGRNLLEALGARLAFVEQAKAVREGLTAILGEDYDTLNKKVVCGVPESAVPAWLKARIAGNPVNNLGAFVRPQYRDVTYFYGIDFHQDLIDFKDRDADFVTLYVYLHPVGLADAPLYVLEGSHALGAVMFPHDLAADGPGFWRYRDGDGREARVRQRVLTGGAGTVAMWHPCTLHGTQPDAADHERISLRYLLAKAPGRRAGMDLVNAQLRGPVRLAATRADLDEKGAARMKANTVNRA
jgi:hypothetical protein